MRGLACTFLIYLWVTDELSFDKFFEHDAQLYQLMERRTVNGDVAISTESSGLLSEAVAATMPEVKYATPLAPPGWFPAVTLSVNDKTFKASGQYAGKDYFNIFSFKLLDGNRNHVLADKSSIVISDELAEKLFQTTQGIIGKPVRFQHEKDFYVSGVFEKPSQHSSQQFDFVLSWDYLKEVQDWVTKWGNLGPLNFVLLKEGTDVNAFNKKVSGIIQANFTDTTRKVFAQKFSDMYLYNSFNNGSEEGSRIGYVRLFSIIAIFIMLIACINFMNLSTAKASRRMKEVGIKKVVGAGRMQLVLQFLSESVLLTLFSMLLAIGVAWLLLPLFNNITGKQMSLFVDGKVAAAILVITAITGLLAGSYPALYLSKFNPLPILKGKLNNSFSEVILRKGLVVFQFSLSAILIVSVVVIYQQIQYIQSTGAGYNKDNVVRLDAEGRINGTEETFVEKLKTIPGVVNAASTLNNMVGHSFGNYGVEWEEKNPNTDVFFEGFRASYGFIETMGMQMQQGRSFSKEFGADSTKIILNEAAVKVMNLKDPVGKTIRLFDQPMQVIGVVKDFHFESLHEVVKPSYITLQNNGSKIMVRIKATDQHQTLTDIQRLYTAYNPGFPFTFSFLDEAYQKQYESEARVAVLSRYFAGLAILISCLGLFGLAAFTAQKRRKEIGIRKVIGASVNDITTMLSKDFLKLVIIALLIAFPLSWYLMNKWLQSFAYRVSIHPFVFVVVAGFLIAITICTISFQAIKAAIANPVKSLRTE